jgi:hypothetical protein
MKLLLVFLLASSSAFASYFATHCSNSRADVRWETGHNSNTLSVKYFDQEERVANLPFFHVEVKLEKESIVREERIHRCGYSSYTKVYTAQAIITPSTDFPTSLDFMGETKKIETEVICTYHINGRAPCPEEDKPTEIIGQ